MSSASNNKGRAYEYAWMQSLYTALSKIRKTRIVSNSSLTANERAWNALDENTQSLFDVSSDAAVKALIELEPIMIEDDGDELVLEFQKDNAGKEGDVRDILIRRGNIQWEVGLSVKHNHDAIKHSRLSHGLDFAKVWFGIPCSKTYWNAVTPIFDRLKAEKAKGTKWSELSDKADSIYIPLLHAFMDEVKSVCKKNPSVPKKMVEYLIGTRDYYKTTSRDSERITAIQTVNIHGTLNKPSKVKVSAITVPVVKLPTELVSIKFKTKSKNTVEMYLNNGWQLSFRIHNAKSEAEPSLKFDINFIGMPPSILHIECKWTGQIIFRDPPPPPGYQEALRKVALKYKNKPL